MNAIKNNGLMTAQEWMDRRTDHPTRCAITRLRLIEMRAADWMPTEEMVELTAAIDGVVDLLRAATEAKA